MDKRTTTQMMYVKSKAPYFCEDDLEIVLVLKGQLTVTKMERTKVLKEGEFTFINRNITHYYKSEEGAYLLVTYVSLAQFKHIFNRIEYVDFLNNDEILEVERPLKYHLNRIIVDKLVKLYQIQDAPEMIKEREFEENQLMNMLFLNYQLITHIKREEEYPTAELLDRYYQVVQYIMENIDKKIMTDDIIKLVYMNPTYFSQFMKRVGGIGFKEFVFYRKLIIICKTLTNPDITMNDTALSVGITDMKSFYHNFKKIFNLSPAKWRQKILMMEDEYEIINDLMILNDFIEKKHIHRHRDNTVTRMLKYLLTCQQQNMDLRNIEIEFDLYQDMGNIFDPDYQAYKHMNTLSQLAHEEGIYMRIKMPMKYLHDENNRHLFLSALKEHLLVFGVPSVKKEEIVLCVANNDEIEKARALQKVIYQKMGNFPITITYVA